MKRININTQQTHFIGCWNLENNKLCNEITNFFDNNKNLQNEIKDCKLVKPIFSVRK